MIDIEQTFRLSRRGLLVGAAAVLAAPAIIRTTGLVMPIKVWRGDVRWLEIGDYAVPPSFLTFVGGLPYRLRDGLKVGPYLPLAEHRTAVRFRPVDISDISEADAAFFRRAKLVLPGGQT